MSQYEQCSGRTKKRLNLIDYDLNYPPLPALCLCMRASPVECVHSRGEFYRFLLLPKLRGIIATSMISYRKFSIANKITINKFDFAPRASKQAGRRTSAYFTSTLGLLSFIYIDKYIFSLATFGAKAKAAETWRKRGSRLLAFVFSLHSILTRNRLRAISCIKKLGKKDERRLLWEG